MIARHASLRDVLMTCLEDRDAGRAIEVALERIAQGTGLDEIVAALTHVQREVGARWQRNEWSLADEHAATATIDRVLAAVAETIDQPAVLPSVVVVCAEDEWHTLAPRMIACLLRARRWDCRFLGASIPAAVLSRDLAAEAPLAMLLTCTLPSSLPGAMRSIAAAHAAGVPVLVGGLAFGDGPGRALAVGADGWAPHAWTADAILQEWAAESRAPGPGPVAAASYEQLRARRAVLVDRGASLKQESGDVGPRGGEEAHEVLLDLVVHLEVAVLTCDPTILTAHLAWRADVRTRRALDPQVLPAAVVFLKAALDAQDLREAAAMLSEGTDAEGCPTGHRSPLPASSPCRPH